MKSSIIAIITLLVTSSTTVLAANVNKRYRSYLTEEGMLYFIMPQTMPKAKGSKALKPMEFDITMKEKSDTVIIRATVISPLPFKENDVTVSTEGKSAKQITASPIYRDLYKKGYKNRIELKLLKDDFRQLYDCTLPYSIDFGQNVLFSYDQRTWQKHSQETKAILEMVELNRESR